MLTARSSAYLEIQSTNVINLTNASVCFQHVLKKMVLKSVRKVSVVAVSSVFLLIMVHSPQMCVLLFIIDWYPRYIKIQQESQDVYVTFNLAPESFEIRQYFSSCFGGGLRNYTSIKPVSFVCLFFINKTITTN